MTDDNKPTKVVFAPGCFDAFEGTQEELDEMVAEIQKAFDNGDFQSIGRELSDEEFADLDEDLREQILNSMNPDFDLDDHKRNLQ